jgi:very-short-patch-repair endonuclease
LWGLEAVPDDPHLIHVLVDPRWAGRRAGVRVHRTGVLTDADRRLHVGLPVTSPERALLDVAPGVDDRVLERAYDQATAARITSEHRVLELIARFQAHAGARRLRALCGDRPSTMTRSEAEELLLALIRSAGLPLPRVNQRVHGFEVDFRWPEAALVVEVDGFAFHSTRAAFERDHARDARLKAAGFEVLRITWRQLEREPLAVIALIAQALARRAGTGQTDR